MWWCIRFTHMVYMNSIGLTPTFYVIEASPLFTIHICQSYSPLFQLLIVISVAMLCLIGISILYLDTKLSTIQHNVLWITSHLTFGFVKFILKVNFWLGQSMKDYKFFAELMRIKKRKCVLCSSLPCFRGRRLFLRPLFHFTMNPFQQIWYNATVRGPVII